jgi:FKBP-type peptidyl-prolyl cis-trans isomerase 2
LSELELQGKGEEIQVLLMSEENIEKNDFIEIDYTGKIKDDDVIFDTTRIDVAKEQNLESKDLKPAIICVGENQVIKGIDDDLPNRKMGDEYKLEVPPEKAFGKKDAKLLKMIPMRVFKKQNIEAQVGLSVQIDGQMGIIRSVSGGRVIVDFNNPLSGKDLIYEIKINRKVTDPKEKIKSIVAPVLGEPNIDIKDNDAIIKINFDMPKEVLEPFKDNIKKAVPELNSIDIVVENQKEAKEITSKQEKNQEDKKAENNHSRKVKI